MHSTTPAAIVNIAECQHATAETALGPGQRHAPVRGAPVCSPSTHPTETRWPRPAQSCVTSWPRGRGASSRELCCSLADHEQLDAQPEGPVVHCCASSTFTQVKRTFYFKFIEARETKYSTRTETCIKLSTEQLKLQHCTIQCWDPAGVAG